MATTKTSAIPSVDDDPRVVEIHDRLHELRKEAGEKEREISERRALLADDAARRQAMAEAVFSGEDVDPGSLLESIDERRARLRTLRDAQALAVAKLAAMRSEVSAEIREKVRPEGEKLAQAACEALVKAGRAVDAFTRWHGSLMEAGVKAGLELPGMDIADLSVADPASRLNWVLDEFTRDYAASPDRSDRDATLRARAAAWEAEQANPREGSTRAGPEGIQTFRRGRWRNA